MVPHKIEFGVGEVFYELILKNAFILQSEPQKSIGTFALKF